MPRGRLALWLVIAACVAGCIDDFSPTPPPQRVEHASGTLSVSADQPMASVPIAAEITAADAGTDVDRAAFFAIDAVLRPRVAGAGTAPPDDEPRGLLVGLRWQGPPGQASVIVWSEAHGDTQALWHEGPNMPVCKRGCSVPVELVILLADPSAGAATIDWTADMDVTYRRDPPPPDTVDIRVGDPAVLPATAMSSMSTSLRPVELADRYPTENRPVKLVALNAPGLAADALGTAVVARVTPSRGEHRSVLVEVAATSNGGGRLRLDTADRQGLGPLAPRWQCDGDGCVGGLDLAFHRVQDTSVGPTTVEWSLITWALVPGVTWQVSEP